MRGYPGAMETQTTRPTPAEVGMGRMFFRAWLLQCLICGHRPIFKRWWTLVDSCPSCGYSFEREEGYWVGAMIMNTGATQLMFFAVFIGGMLLTWPDVPWTLLLVGNLVLIAAFPAVFYPWSKTLWLWMDFLIHPLKREEAS
jgi:uncharacterized protein (DUF983 family)